MGRPIWNLLTGTAIKYLFLFVNIVIGIFLMPFTMHHLGKAEYGLWMLVTSMTAYFQLLDLGYGNGLVRQITHADARGDDEEVNTILSTFVGVYSAIGMIALLLVVVLVTFVVPRFPNLSPSQVVTAQWLLGILGFRAAIGFPMAVFGAVSTARQRFALTGSIAIGVSLLQALVTYVMLSAGYGLVPLVAATTTVSLLSYVAYGLVAKSIFPQMHLSLARFSPSQLRQVTSFSMYLFLISIAIQVDTHVDNLVIGGTLGTGAIAVYAIAVRLADYQRQLCGQFGQLLFPIVVRFHADDNRAALRTLLLEGTRLAVALASILTVCLIAFGPQLVERWMGPGFEDAAGPLYVMTAVSIVVVGQGPAGNILLGAGRHRFVGLLAMVQVVCNLALTLVLVRRFGLLGVALGTAIPYTVLNAGILVPAVCRTLEVPTRTLARTALLPALIGSTAGASTAVALQALARSHSLSGLLVQCAIVAVTYGVAFWFAGLSGLERRRYMQSARHVSAGFLRARPAGAAF
jgi:O-antigen/teichoic acid export membrane protein